MSTSPNDAPRKDASLLERYGKTSIDRVRASMADISAGKCVILVDDEDRENEGDLVYAAEKTSPELINFMAKEGRGLICLPLADERLELLDIPLMVDRNSSGFGTAFTVSIEARTGVTTGISAKDRSRTVEVAIAEGTRPDDLVRPGHIFPLRAQPGGVLVRTGQTEGSVDLARLAGLKPAAVICEILKDDGEMARLPDLVEFASKHELNICSVADLIAYRLEHEFLVERKAEETVKTPAGELRAIAFRSTVDDREALALVKGTDEELAEASKNGEAPLVRVHSGDPLTDVFGGILDRGGLMLQGAFDAVAQEKLGVILYLPRAPEPIHFVDALQRINDAKQSGADLPEKDRAPKGESPVVRHYGTGAQIFRQLGLSRIRLLTNNPLRLNAAKGFGLDIVGHVAIPTK
ncbi:MAG: 3,4-dihydroxy-2-butanone-4-phosphate synthase [Deltaproteobacteria bacterium]|nr:3,4-dihydroxy-2-butanone-4-phosphate synthase [Deltaproteobacteria bacterium]